MSYRILLDAHSYWRWIVLAVAAVALAVTLSAWRARVWTPRDERWAKLFVIAVDIQLVFGLGLWFGLSPYWTALMQHPQEAMKNGVVRFWSVEHETAMLLAVVVAHVGRVMSKRRAADGRARTFGVALIVWWVCVLAGFPWPGLSYGRLLLRAP